MILKNEDIEKAFIECLESYPINDPIKKAVIANDFFYNGARWAALEVPYTIDKNEERISEAVSIAVGSAEKEQYEKIENWLKEIATSFHKSGKHTEGHTVEYLIENLHLA